MDQSATVAFSTQLESDPGQGASAENLARIRALHTTGLTALFDSLAQASALFAKQNFELSPTRRALVLLSGGVDNCLHSIHDAIAAARKADVVICAVTAQEPDRS